jgi:uncharacterized membrane protein
VRKERLSPRLKLHTFLSLALLSTIAGISSLFGQAKPVPGPPHSAAQKPAAGVTAGQKTAVGPPSPQSKHYPILLLAFGNAPNWSLRIGQKGPERFDREGYPPIPLESVEVTHEGAVDTWTYHAKDSATGAPVAIRVSRGSCTDAANDGISPTKPAGGKFPFSASVEHAQTGAVKGCARIAAELFPRINNQPLDEDDDAKHKPPAPTVTNFKPPVAIAYLNSAGKIVFKKGAAIHVVPSESPEFSVSHDGSRLLYLREEKSGNKAIALYDFASQKSTDLTKGNVREAFWSPEDSRFAFLKNVDGKSQLWLGTIASPDSAASIYSGDLTSIHSWTDPHTLLVRDKQDLLWLSDTGVIQQRIAEKDFLGDDFISSSINTFRVHPLNPDLMLISAKLAKPQQGVPLDDRIGGSAGLLLYEIRSKRRVPMPTPNFSSQSAEWSRDGLQVFFTATDSAHHSVTNRIFWDGTGLIKYLTGTNLVVGQ